MKPLWFLVNWFFIMLLAVAKIITGIQWLLCLGFIRFNIDQRVEAMYADVAWWMEQKEGKL